MTTTQTPSVGELLRNHRYDNHLSKAAMYRALDVSAQTYDTWEGGTYIPGDEYAERIAGLLDYELKEVVWLLYRDRVARLAHNPRNDMLAVRSFGLLAAAV